MRTAQELFEEVTSRKATFDLHRMCEMGLFELKGQSRNAYYIAGPNLEPHIGKNDGEISRADGENGRADGEISRADGEMCRADGEMCRANGEMCRADILPLVLQERIKKIGKRAATSEIRSLIIELCTFNPFGIAELAQLLNRDMKALRYHYINPLLKQGKLFYTIPEMLNHPNQKYTTKKKQ